VTKSTKLINVFEQHSVYVISTISPQHGPHCEFVSQISLGW